MLRHLPKVNELLRQKNPSPHWKLSGGIAVGARPVQKGRLRIPMLHVCEMVDGIEEPVPRVSLPYSFQPLPIPIIHGFTFDQVRVILPLSEVRTPLFSESISTNLGLALNYDSDGLVKFPIRLVGTGGTVEVNERIVQQIFREGVKANIHFRLAVAGVLSFAELALQGNESSDWGPMFREFLRV
ncbi:hypothetical protein A2866_05240 [Candidatus Roizmanbacteria bacterium RIFCSPHIGHO2_01_FULL_39_8]|nr:MAG: hypothetical protein A2866_05240 [Candidatus Roizmanbacteria bacterium RIFCSPHIGHO2_01_FULL_39_8]